MGGLEKKIVKNIIVATGCTVLFLSSYLLSGCSTAQVNTSFNSGISEVPKTNLLYIENNQNLGNNVFFIPPFLTGGTASEETTKDISEMSNEEIDALIQDKIQSKQYYKDTGYVITGFGNKIPGGIALTVDDCGASKYALDMIEKDNEVRAEMGLPPNHITFLPIAEYYDNNKIIDVYQYALENGHLFANHTYKHPMLRKASNERIVSEIINSQEKFKEKFGFDMLPYMRPPGGNWDGRVCEIAKLCGIEHILMWNRSFADCATQADGTPVTASYCIKYISGVKEGDLVLCHWRQNSIDAMPYFLDLLRERGLTSYTLYDYLGSENQL